MASDTAPPGYRTVTPYLVVPGVARLLEFLKQVFDAEVTERMDREDGTVVHAEVRIGDSIIMLGEATGDHKCWPAMLYLYLEDCDSAYQRAMVAGASSVREPVDEFYGDRVAAVEDHAGNQWWMATRKETLSQDELMRRAQEARKQ